MNSEQYKQMSDILEELAKLLDVTEKEFNTIIKSYEAVGTFLAEGSSPLRDFSPSIHPQGSFLLGTVVRPISDEDDLDIDLVCELENKPQNWVQFNLKKAVGDRLKASNLYKQKLDKEGKRCWTLLYGDNKYHLDVLPSLVCKDYRTIVTRYFSEATPKNPEELAIHITDNTRADYYTEQDERKWMVSNPFGYAQWFLSSAQAAYRKQQTFSMEAKIDPVPKFNHGKYALQRVVQLLKRHRDKMFDGDDDKPISIIITTLATRVYNEEQNIYLALKHIAANMSSKIEDRNGTKWVANPVNGSENFADRWPQNPQKQKKFYDWLDKLQKDVDRLEYSFGKGLQEVKKVLVDMFGESVSSRTYENYSKLLLEQRKSGNLRIASTGILGTLGATKVAAHNFYGTEKEDS